MTLYERIKAIRNAIQDRVETELGSDVSAVIVGTKDKAWRFHPPMIWIIPLQSTVDDNRVALGEMWSMDFMILSIVKSTRDSEEARSLAEELTLRARGSLYIDPTTSRHDRHLKTLQVPNGLVEDIVSVSWSPGDSQILDEDESLFGSGLHVRITFHNAEVK